MLKDRIKLQDNFTVEDCQNNPRFIYIFGDNLLEQGKGGQAIIRDCPNSYGIPIKNSPTMSHDAFFTDEFYQYEKVKDALERLYMRYHASQYGAKNYQKFIFPTAGLGTGRAKMEEYSPKLFRYLNESLYRYFGIYKELLS